MMEKRNIGLDIVRSFAIIPVMAVHFSGTLSHPAPAIVYIFGNFGVEIFFALSGFLIGGIILKDFDRGFSTDVAANFYIRRWMRTIPLYWVFYVINMYVTVNGFTLDPNWTVKNLLYLPFLQNFAWPMLASWYHESWSLAIEEWFYLLFPILIFVVPAKTNYQRVMLIALILIIVPTVIRTLAYSPSANWDDVRKTLVFRLDAIAYGILAIWFVRSQPKLSEKLSLYLGVIGLVGASVTALMFAQYIPVSDYFQKTYIFSIVSASFALVVIGAYWQFKKPIKANYVTRCFYWISTRSYVLYLCHGSIVKLLIYYGYYGAPIAKTLPIFVLASIIIAEIGHRLIEKPFMKMRPQISSRRMLEAGA